MKELSFLELKQNRKELLEAHKKNNFTDGIRALLTDLYPDTAHFIYELLQNAEDMFAKNVEFKLYSDRLEFLHDGTKRDFNLKDIDAITNIGHNAQKKNDPTSIGKFGVGFKAVFAYTSTPEIHSGNYHFKIKEYFLPDEDNVPIKETNGKTIFIFPFNNPKKPQIQAYEEILKSLREIDDNTILFLKNIQKITYSLSDEESGYVYGKRESQNFYKIRYKHIYKEEKVSTWLRFIKDIDIIDEQGNKKELNIGVAYSIEEKNNEYKITPIQGKTFIYFPAVKEHSGLFFNINAPFASTVARDSLRDIKENYNLIDRIGKLIYDTFEILRDKNLINNSLFKTLPNLDDNISLMYQKILEYIKKAFIEKNLIPTLNEKYGYVKSTEAIIGRNNFQKIFNEENLEKLLGRKLYWINNPPVNQRENKFLDYIGVFTLNYKEICDFILDGKFKEITKTIDELSNDNIKILYSILYTTYEDNFPKSYFNFERTRRTFRDEENFISFLKGMEIIKTTMGMVKTEQALFLPQEMKPISNDNAFIIKELYEGDDNNSENSRKFLEKILGIKEYSLAVEIEKKLKEIENDKTLGVTLNKKYFNELLEIAKYINETNEFKDEWKKYRFLLCEINGRNYKMNIENIIIENENIIGDLKKIASVLNKNIISTEYQKTYSKEEYQIFKKFLENLNLKYKIKFIKIKANENPCFYNSLFAYGKETNKGKNLDYTVFKLKELLNLKSFEFSKDLLETLNLIDNFRFSEISKAEYSPNAKMIVKSCDSSLLYYLKEIQWILGKDNNWYTPLELDVEEIAEQYHINLNEILINKLCFGYNKKIKKKEIEEKLTKEEEIENFKKQHENCLIIDMEKISLEDQKILKKYVESLENKKLTIKEEKKIDLEDDFKKLTKENKFENFNEDFNNLGMVKNIEKREENIEKTFIEKRLEERTPLEKRMTIISKASTEEKEMLLNEYNGKCQICSTTITSINNKKIFYATNILDTRDFPLDIKNTIDIGWNSLSLCPNCYAKYKNCSKDLSNFLEQVRNHKVIEYDTSRILIEIKLEGRTQYIKYTQRHFLALKKIIELLENS